MTTPMRPYGQQSSSTDHSAVDDDDEQSLSASSFLTSSLLHDADDEESLGLYGHSQTSFQSPLERHMIKIFAASLSDISAVSLISDNARSAGVSSPTTLDPPPLSYTTSTTSSSSGNNIDTNASNRNSIQPALAKSLQERCSLLSPKRRVSRWSASGVADSPISEGQSASTTYSSGTSFKSPNQQQLQHNVDKEVASPKLMNTQKAARPTSPPPPPPPTSPTYLDQQVHIAEETSDSRWKNFASPSSYHHHHHHRSKSAAAAVTSGSSPIEFFTSCHSDLILMKPERRPSQSSISSTNSTESFASFSDLEVDDVVVDEVPIATKKKQERQRSDVKESAK